MIDVNGDPPPPVVGIKAGAGLGKTGGRAGADRCGSRQSEHKNIEVYVPDPSAQAEELADRARA